jgi:hypothetical protein
MPGRDPLNSIADLAALQAEADKVIAVIRGIDEAVKSVSQVKSLYKDAGNSAEQKKASEDLVQGNKAVEAAQKTLNAETQKGITLQSEMAKQIAITKEQNKQKTKEITAEAREAAGLNDAYKKLELQYAAASREAKNLAATQGANTQEAKNAAAVAKELSNQLKEIDASVGQNQRKVGDYTGALKTLESELQRVREELSKTKTAQSSLIAGGPSIPSANQNRQAVGSGVRTPQPGDIQAVANYNAELQKTNATVSKLEEQEQLLSTIVSNQSHGFNSVTQDIRAQEKVLQTLRAAGLEDSEAFKQLRIEVANAHKEFNEFNNQQRLLESHAPGLKALTVAAKGLGGAYALSAGAVALFGDEEGKIEKETQKLIAIMTILQGLNEVAELIEQRKAVAIALSTTATKIAQIAQKVWAATMLESTIATIGFRTALITVTGGLLLLLPLAISVFSKLAENAEDARREQELLNEVNKKSIEGYAEERAQIELNVKQLQDENISRADKTRLIDDLQHKYPEYLGNIKNEGTLTEDLSKAIKEKLIPALELEAKAKAAQQLATEKYKKLLELQNNAIEEGSTGLAYALQSAGAVFGSTTLTAEGFSKALENTNEETSKLQKEIDGLFKISLDADDQLQKLGGHITDHEIKSNLIDITKEIEARSKLIELIKQQQIELTKPFSDSNNNPEFSRVKALQQAYELEKQILTNRLNTSLQLNSIEQQKLKHDTEEQLSNLKLTEKEKDEISAQFATNERALELQRKALILQTNDDLFKSDITYNIARGKAHADALQRIVDDEKQTREELAALEKNQQKAQEDLLQAQFQKRKDYISQARDIELKNLEDTFANGGFKEKIDEFGVLQTAEKQYQDERQKIEGDAAGYILRTEEDLIKQQISLKKALGQDTIDLEAKLANIELQIEQKKDKDKIQSNKDALEAKKKLAEKEKEIAEKTADFVVAFVSGASERALNSLQDQIDANTKLKDAETERINNSTLSEQDKAARLAQINATAQAKQDQLEAKQRQEKLREAKFERDAQGLKILGETLFQAAKAGWITPQAIAIEAIGAIEIATLFAKPLPKYATGTDNAPGGLAIVGELGPELRIEPTGQISLTPGQPTLTNLLPGTQIIPHDEVNQMMLHAMMQNVVKIPEREDLAAKKIDRLTEIIKWQHQELINAFARIARQNRPKFPPNYPDYRDDYIP